MAGASLLQALCPEWAAPRFSDALSPPVQICGHRAVLVGDAAHAVTSVMGQGCNTALSTCTALDRALAAVNPSSTAQLDAALEKFNAEWLPEAHALQQQEYMAVRSVNTSTFHRLRAASCVHPLL